MDIAKRIFEAINVAINEDTTNYYKSGHYDAKELPLLNAETKTSADGQTMVLIFGRDGGSEYMVSVKRIR